MQTELRCDPLEALNEALCREQEGYEFYLKAAEWTKNPTGAQRFRTLAGQASVQSELLEAQIEALTLNNTWMLPECVLDCAFDLEAPPYPRDEASLERELRPDASDLDAILFALQAENTNYGYYARQAKTSTDAQARKFYTYLAEQTRTRLDLLMLSYEGVAPNVVALHD